MARHVDDLLPEYLLGTLASEPQREVEQHLSRCELCSRLHARLRRSTEALAAAVPPRPPAASVRERLMAFVRGEGRFADFVPELARLFDVDEATARQLVTRLHEPDAWMEGPVPGVHIQPVEGGPRLEGAFSAFVRLPPGQRFPTHLHGGTEKNFVLQGGFREDSGLEIWAGESLEKTLGTTHAYVALEGPDCIAASVVWGEIQLTEEER